MIRNFIRSSTSEQSTLLLGILTFLISFSVILFLDLSKILISDLITYSEWSLDPLSHRQPNHLPGLPIMTYLLRLVTFDYIPTINLMQIICLFSWLLLYFFSIRILNLIAPERKKVFLLLIMLFPFFGISFLTYPIADIPSHAFLSGVIYGYYARSRNTMIIFLILCSLIHKMMWPFIGLIMLVSIYEKRINFFDCFLVSLPLLSYYISVYIYNDFQSLNDLGIFWNLNYDMSLVDNDFYPLKGVIDSFLQGDFRSITKAFLIVCSLLTCLILSFFTWYRRNYFLLSLILPIIVLTLIIGEFTSAAVLRHSKFILIPIAAYSNSLFLSSFVRDKYYWPIAFFLVLSQLIFTWNIFIGF